MYNLETSYGLGVSFATDDAKPSHHFAQETPSPTILLARTRIGIMRLMIGVGNDR